MNVNPYQSPASVCERPGNRGEPAKERRFRRLISLGEILLWLYNVYLFGFLAFLLLNLTLQVFGLSLPELAAAGYAIFLCTVAVVGALGNAYVLCLVLRLLAAQPRKYGLLRRHYFAILVFVPVWGRCWYRQLLADRLESTSISVRFPGP